MLIQTPRLFAFVPRAGWLAALLAAVSFVSAGCGEAGGADGSADAGRPVFVATTTMLTDAVARIAGDRAEVVGLMGPGIDPHLYTPTRSDLQRLLSADAVFLNGHFLEGHLGDALDRASAAGKPVFAIAELLDEGELLRVGEGEDAFDPHIWMDPAVWSLAVGAVRDALVGVDPSGAEVYTANAEAYLAEIAELDARAERRMASVPESARVLVTAHDAFGYFGRRYGFEVRGVQGLSTESEAGLRDIERLAELLADRGVPALFTESSVSDRAVRAVLADARARGHTVAIGGELFSDATGPAGTPEATYIGMIDHNTATIAQALGGSAGDGADDGPDAAGGGG